MHGRSSAALTTVQSIDMVISNYNLVSQGTE
jgi:hypothetical protein